MITQLLQDNLLRFPALFISGYLSEHEDYYKKLLLKVSAEGEWWEFIYFMLNGFIIQAKKTHIGILQLKEAKKDIKQQLFNSSEILIRRANITVVVDHIFLQPVTHAKFMEKELKIYWQTCTKYLRELARLGILKEEKDGKYKFFRNERAFKAVVIKPNQIVASKSLYEKF